MKKSNEAEKIEIREEKQEKPKAAMTEIVPGLWRTRTGSEVREVVERNGVFRATVTRPSDVTTQIVGDYKTIREAFEAFEDNDTATQEEAVPKDQTGDDSV